MPIAEMTNAGSVAPPRAGQIVGERYRLVEWLESGAMGSVWRAEQVRLRSRAAVKFLDPSLIEVPEMLERFLQEARSAAAVQSAHVIQVFDFGRDGGLPYIAMELLEGENLHARLARRGRLTPAELEKIFSELARGLGQAHALGVIHRDVKPGNIFLAREGKHEVTKLIDFGIAKVRADALRVSQIVGTDNGTLLGTPQYMSPEQMRGRATVDYRSDLWALAIIGCECLTGRYPFAATTLGDLTVQICTEEPLAPSTLGEVPHGFDQWFFKGTSKDPGDRFASAADMAEALRNILVPRERAAASVRRTARLVLPRILAWRRAWAASSSVVLRRWTWPFERAWALVSSALVRVVRRAAARQLSAWPAALGLLLLVLASSLVLWRPQQDHSFRATPAPAASGARDATAVSERQAVLPKRPSPAPEPTIARRPDPVTIAQELPDPATLPVLTPGDLPLAVTSEARSTAARAPESRHRSKKLSPPATSASNALPASSPMPDAMARLGALIAQGGDKNRPARAKAAPPLRARPAASAHTR